MAKTAYGLRQPTLHRRTPPMPSQVPAEQIGGHAYPQARAAACACIHRYIFRLQRLLALERQPGAIEAAGPCRTLCGTPQMRKVGSRRVCCPRPQRRPATLRRQKKDRCTPANLLFDNPSTVDPTSSQPGDGDLFAISGRGPERDRGQCLSDHARLVVAAGYRRRC